MGRLGFFTGTLTPWVLNKLKFCVNGWGEGMSFFRKSLRQLCRRRGLKVLQLDVTEIQMERYHSTGEVAPHVHMVLLVRNKTGSTSPWLIAPEEMQRLWDAAFNRVIGVESAPEPNFTECVPVLKDVFGYLRKYFSKGNESDEIDWTGWEHVRPKQWCSQSKELKDAVKAMTTHHPGMFMDWLELNEPLLKGRGFYHLKTYAPDDIPVGNIAEVQFYSPEAELVLFTRFLEDWRKSIRFEAGLPYEEFDPVASLGLPVPSADLQAQLPRTLPVGSPIPVTQDLRERLDILLVNSQIPEPVFGPPVTLLEKEGTETQLDLFLSVNRSVLECHLGAEGSDE